MIRSGVINLPLFRRKTDTLYMIPCSEMRNKSIKTGKCYGAVRLKYGKDIQACAPAPGQETTADGLGCQMCSWEKQV